MSLLTMVENVANETQLAQPPTTVVGNADAFAKQALSLLTKLGLELLAQHNWRELVKESTFTTDGTGSYIIGTDIVTDGDFAHFISDTLWDRSNTNRIEIVNARQWQTLVSGVISSAGVIRFARTRGKNFLMTPDASGDTIAFEYLSNFWVESSGGIAKAAFTVDTDTTLYSEHLLELGLSMKLKQAKGLPWAADMDAFERERERLIGEEMPLETLGARSLNNFVINIPQTGFGS